MDYGMFFSMFLVLAMVHIASFKPALVDEFRCPRVEGLFAHPKHCRRFFMCAENFGHEQSCPPGLYFDDEKKHCLYKTKDLKCGPLPLAPIVTTTPDSLAAFKCDESQCSLPKCFCSKNGLRAPAGLKRDNIPLMITISFDGALNAHNLAMYTNIMETVGKNPNGCPGSFTFFVSHSYSDYSIIQNMAHLGNEIALNGIYGREPETWWETATTEEWKEQMEGQRQMLVKFANLTKESIVGMRSPFIRNGGNEMVNMMKEIGLTYDSSLPSATKSPIWPYTFDYKMPHRCIGTKRCPTRSFPGIWEYPMNMLFSEDGTGGTCALADQCVFPDDSELIEEFFMENVNRHDKNSKAPLGIYMHSNWFQNGEKVDGITRFIKKLKATYPKAYFVSINKVIDWMKRPAAGLDAHPAFDCPAPTVPECYAANSCVIEFMNDGIQETRYMNTCSMCPRRYPWVGNPEGAMKAGDIEVEADNSHKEEEFENERAYAPMEEEEEEES